MLEDINQGSPVEGEDCAQSVQVNWGWCIGKLNRSTLADFALNRAFFSDSLSYRKRAGNHYQPPRDCASCTLLGPYHIEVVGGTIREKSMLE